MMKKGLVTMILALTMAMVSSVAFAAQVVELNETYMLEQTRTAVNTHLTEVKEDARFYSPMHRRKDPNDYTRSYTSINQREWMLIINQNEQGYDCNIGMVIPGYEERRTVAMAGISLLSAAIGKDYSIDSQERYVIVNTSWGAIKHGKSSFYYNGTHRYYELNTTYNDRDNNWYLVVIAYVYN